MIIQLGIADRMYRRGQSKFVRAGHQISRARVSVRIQRYDELEAFWVFPNPALLSRGRLPFEILGNQIVFAVNDSATCK